MAAFGISMVKDEADVIAGTLRHMADEVDHLIVADNNSTDGTRDILADLTRDIPLTVVDDPEAAYYQSFKMSRLAERAVDAGAVWIVPFDADELWVAEHRISTLLAGVDCDVAEATLFNHFATSIDPDEPDPFRQIVWRQRQPGGLPKVAFRWRPGAAIHQGNHGVDLPGDVHRERLLEVRHFPYRSAAQFVRKARNGAAAYKAANLPEHEGAHWRAYGEILDRHGVEALEDVFRTHFWYLSPTDAGMVLDPAPYMRWR